MRSWLEGASESLSASVACQRAGIGLSRYVISRRDDRTFDDAAQVIDQVVDIVIQDKVRERSMEGDMTAARLYYSNVRQPGYIPPFASSARKPPEPNPHDPHLDPHVAEAMIAAGIAASSQPPPHTEP